MLTKRQLGSGKVEVTFTMPGLEGVTRLYLVGDFNDWSIVSNPMTRAADGSWGSTLPLEAESNYQFRYFDNNGHWHNDWQADAYVPNQFGGDNSVVSTELEVAGAAPTDETAPVKPKRRATTTRKKSAAAGGEAAPARPKTTRKKKTE
jgi:1,4-alpha-glucan branching enzyme